MIFFTADQHFGHKNIITYCQRPFNTVEEMDEEIITRHNTVICKHDTVVHVGDFTLIHDTDRVMQMYVSRLNGEHVFLAGSHDKWLKNAPSVYEYRDKSHFIVACHYAMRVWNRSHYNSWQVYGHSHGNLRPQGKQHDVGVDCNDFTPVSLYDLDAIMRSRPDNFNLVRKR